MDIIERRARLLQSLQTATGPVSATALAGRFGVTRQVIVNDVALLRAAGADICATPRGYLILPRSGGLVRRVACRHTAAQMEEELRLLVESGCTVVDVIVEHPLYGQLTGPLQLATQEDVTLFVHRCAASTAQPLSRLTQGVHLHTLSCPGESAFEAAYAALARAGFLLEENG